ncbi:MAG: hypothetical protein K0S55_356, partial [Clostridia bacterium]|nr:hypothetical protein [Clostridia bacterium]
MIKLFKNKKGGAMVAVLGIVLVVTMLSVTALMTSLVNIKSSERQFEWTDEFYSLDSEMELFVAYCDGKTTQTAEKFAGAYLEKELYKNAAISNWVDALGPIYSELPNKLKNSLNNMQTFFNSRWSVIKTLWEADPDPLTSQATYIQAFLKDSYEILYFFGLNQIKADLFYIDALTNGKTVFMGSFGHPDFNYDINIVQTSTASPIYTAIAEGTAAAWNDFLLNASFTDSNKPVFKMTLSVREIGLTGEKAR